MNAWYDSAIGRLFAIVLSILTLWAAMTLTGALGDSYRSAKHTVSNHALRVAP